jgi:hypothetical protein
MENSSDSISSTTYNQLIGTSLGQLDFFETTFEVVTAITDFDLISLFTCSSKKYLPELDEVRVVKFRPFAAAEEPVAVFADSLKIMAEHKELQLLTTLLRSGVALLKSFKCNQEAADVFRFRLEEVAHYFAVQYGPLHSIPVASNVESIAALENCLADWLRYCRRFTNNDFAVYLIYGHEPRKQFEQFSSNLFRCMQAVGAHHSNSIDAGERYVIQSTTKYYIACNLLPIIKKLKSDNSSSEEAPAARGGPGAPKKFGINVESIIAKHGGPSAAGLTVTNELRVSVKKDIRAAQAALDLLTNEAMHETTAGASKPYYFLIKQRALREFWMMKVHPTLSVTEKKLAVMVQTFLSARGAGSAVATALANSFRALAIKELDDTGHVDPFTIARLGRRVLLDFREKHFVEIVKEIVDGSSHRQSLVILPHRFLEPQDAVVGQHHSSHNNKEDSDFRNAVFESRDQESDICRLFHRVGWSLITGARLSGKSCRLLHCVHTEVMNKEENNRDYIWIDFDGVTNEMEGIARIACTLYLRRCLQYGVHGHKWQAFEQELSSFMSGLRLGSVIVLDNVRLRHQRLHGIGTSKMAVLDSFDKSKQAKLLSFFRRLMDSLNVHCRSLSIIIVTDSPEVLMRPLGQSGSNAKHNLSPVHANRGPTSSLSKSSNKNQDTAAFNIHFLDTVHIGPLSNEAATTLIDAVSPGYGCVDRDALKLASGNLSGLLCELVASCPMRTIRKTANTLQECVVGAAELDSESSRGVNSNKLEAVRLFALSEAMQQTYFHSLSEDERLLASILDTNWSYFDECFAWNLSKDVFRNNLLRWKLAWNGLLTAHWLNHDDIELGFKCSYLSSLVQPVCSSLTPQQIYDDLYLVHLAQEMVRMNDLCGDWCCGLEYFGRYIHHFNHILMCLYLYNKSMKQETANKSEIRDDGLFGLHLDHMLGDFTHLFDNAAIAGHAPNPADNNSPSPAISPTMTVSTDGEFEDVNSGESDDLLGSADYDLDEEKIRKSTHRLTQPAATLSSTSSNNKSSTANRFVSSIVFADHEHYHHHRHHKNPSDHAIAKVIGILCGHISNLLTYNTTPHQGRMLAHIVLNACEAYSSDEDSEEQSSEEKMCEALLDVCEQELRCDESAAALHRLEHMLTHIQTNFIPITNMTSHTHLSERHYRINSGLSNADLTIPLYAPRAMLVHGQLLQHLNHLSEARTAYANAIKLYQYKGMTPDNSWACSLAVGHHDHVCTMLAQQPATSMAPLVDFSKIAGAVTGTVAGVGAAAASTPQRPVSTRHVGIGSPLRALQSSSKASNIRASGAMIDDKKPGWFSKAGVWEETKIVLRFNEK